MKASLDVAKTLLSVFLEFWCCNDLSKSLLEDVLKAGGSVVEAAFGNIMAEAVTVISDENSRVLSGPPPKSYCD